MFSLIRTNSVIQTEDEIGLRSAVWISEDVLYLYHWVTQLRFESLYHQMNRVMQGLGKTKARNFTLFETFCITEWNNFLYHRVAKLLYQRVKQETFVSQSETTFCITEWQNFCIKEWNKRLLYHRVKQLFVSQSDETFVSQSDKTFVSQSDARFETFYTL